MPSALAAAPGTRLRAAWTPCPAPSWDPAGSPDPGCGGGSYRLGMGVGCLGGLQGRGRGLLACRGRAFWDTPESSQATRVRGVALWEGRSVRMAAGVAGHPAARGELLPAPGDAGGDGALCWLWEPHRDGLGWREGCRSGRDTGAPAGTFAKPLSLTRRGRHLPSSGTSTPQTSPALPQICAVELYFRNGV